MDQNENEQQQYAMQLATASVLPMALKAAIELGVFKILEKAGPDACLSSSQIVSQFPNHHNPDAPLVLDRILSLLATHSILNCSLSSSTATIEQGGLVCDNKLYGLAPVSKYFTPSQSHGGSLSPFLTMIQDGVMMDIWGHLKEAVLEGGVPFDKAHGIDAGEMARKDERWGQVSKASFGDFNPLIMERILEKYDGFEGLESLVDVGGGDGSVLNMILSKYPTIKGINYDLAPVIEKAPSYPGIEHVVGDMFVSIPKGNAIFMKWVTHGVEDERLIKVLMNGHEAMPATGKVIIVDMVMPETPETDAAAKCLSQFYLFMTSVNPRARGRTKREFQNLAKEAGFSGFRVACRAYNYSVLEFIKGP